MVGQDCVHRAKVRGTGLHFPEKQVLKSRHGERAKKNIPGQMCHRVVPDPHSLALLINRSWPSGPDLAASFDSVPN